MIVILSSPARIRTSNLEVTKTLLLPKGLDYLITIPFGLGGGRLTVYSHLVSAPSPLSGAWLRISRLRRPFPEFTHLSSRYFYRELLTQLPALPLSYRGILNCQLLFLLAIAECIGYFSIKESINPSHYLAMCCRIAKTDCEYSVFMKIFSYFLVCFLFDNICFVKLI